MATTVSLIINEQFLFAEIDPGGNCRLQQTFNLVDVLEHGFPDGAIGKGDNALLLVPDYWLGVKTFPIATSKPSLVVPFIRKKLQLEPGSEPEDAEFFDYLHYQDEEGGRGVTVYHSQEHQLARLHGHLSAIGRAPLAITSPGLIWESYLRTADSGFSEGGKLLICLIGSECFFFFFHQGRFLFSRDFSVFKDADPEDRIDALAYEIQQSRFLFAQKTRGEVDEVLLAMGHTTAVSAPDLAEKAGRPVRVLHIRPAQAIGFVEDSYTPMLFFTPKDWGRKARFVNLAHRQVRLEREWWLPQTVGLVIGALLLAMLGAQAYFLQSSVSAEQVRQRNAQIREQSAQVRRYSDSMGEILQRWRVPSANVTLVRLAQSLPENVNLDGFSLDLTDKRLLKVEGMVHAEGAEAFKRTLLDLIGKVKERYPGNDELSYKDIEFSTDHVVAGEPLRDFRITFKVKL